MKRDGGSGKRRGLTCARRAVQVASIAFFFYLAFAAAYPPSALPPANLFLRVDPVMGAFSLTASMSLSAFALFWPAWVLLGLTMLSSRFFCGWICPLGTCFDAVGAFKPKALKYYKPRGKDSRELLERYRAGELPRRLRVKYAILALLLALSLAGVNLLYFISPLVISNRTVYYVLLPQVPVLFIILLLVAFAYRPRFWCEEICPLGALLSVASMAGKRLRPRLSPLSVVKEPGACVWCGACYRECPFGVEEPFLKEDAGRLRSADCTACGACVQACPATDALRLESFGTVLYRSKGRKSAVERTAERAPVEPAPSRGGLTVSRREFVASLGLGAVVLAGYGLGLRGRGETVLRMPGAQDEPRFLASCSRCAECARACPTGCIRPMGLEAGFQKLWTPRFYPRRAACTFDLCGQACAGVCPSGAIERLEPSEVRIGTARISKRTCLAWRGKTCLVCHERCRFKAIEVDGLRRPGVSEDNCTGCGACQQTCPTEPASIQVYAARYEFESGTGRGRQDGD